MTSRRNQSRRPSPEEWDDDDDDFAYPEGEDLEDQITVPCPYCKREILEDAPWCPYCETYLTAETAPTERKPTWFIIAAVLCLLAALHWIVW